MRLHPHIFVFYLILSALLGKGCEAISGSGDSGWESLALYGLDGQKSLLFSQATDSFTVLLFLSPECPLCENYSKTISELRSGFSEAPIRWLGIFPGSAYSKEQIYHYLSRYHPQVEVVLDPNQELTQKVKATVTPEVVLLSEKREIQYRGKIDNWIESLGVKRQKVTEHYLLDALEAVLKNEKPLIVSTEAVGCFIE